MKIVYTVVVYTCKTKFLLIDIWKLKFLLLKIKQITVLWF